MKKILCIILYVLLFFNMCTTYKNTEMNNININENIIKLEELTIKYSLYGNFIINNNLPLYKFKDIIDSIVDEIELIIYYFDNLMDSNIDEFEIHQILKLELLTKIIIDMNSKLMDYYEQ